MDSTIIAVVVAFIAGGAYFVFGRKNSVSAKILQFEKKDSELKVKEDQAKKEVDELNRRLQNLENDAKDLDPEKIVDYWNDENNN